MNLNAEYIGLGVVIGFGIVYLIYRFWPVLKRKKAIDLVKALELERGKTYILKIDWGVVSDAGAVAALGCRLM